MIWMFKEIFFTVVWDVFTFWVAKKILRHFVNQSEITLKQKATYLLVRLRRSNSLRTRMETLAKRRLTLCIFPRLAGMPTSYVFSELLLVHKPACSCCDWLGRRSRHFFQPIRGKTKANGNLLTHVFNHLVPGTCIYVETWLTHLTVCAYCDWLGKKSHHFSSQSEDSHHVCWKIVTYHVAPTRMLIHVLPICKKRESQHYRRRKEEQSGKS